VNGANAEIVLRDGVAVLDMQLASHELATRWPQFPFPATEAFNLKVSERPQAHDGSA
jgi:hypothetical protein